MKRKFGVDISYSVAWRGRECVYENLRLGTPEQSYTLLPGYLHMLMATNPGSVVNLEVSDGNKFQSHAPSRRYNIMTTNISESLNAVLVKVRELPITAFVNEIRLLCQKWFHERRTKAAGCTTMMSKDVETKLEERKDRAQAMGVICADQYTFDVVDGDRNYCVDMALWTCTCQKFQLDQLPCDHVLASLMPYYKFDLLL
ncbi:hypothetical protein UlMin_023972 [Ulmus minor]